MYGLSIKQGGIIAFCAMISMSTIGCTTQQSTSQPLLSASFAECISSKGLKMYGTERCPHCKNQKKAFGEHFAKVTYIDCDKQKTACTIAKVTGFPTRIDAQGNQYPGYQSPEQLATISSCSLQ